MKRQQTGVRAAIVAMKRRNGCGVKGEQEDGYARKHKWK
jgi:hypothetical protein